MFSEFPDWAKFILVAVGLAALLTIIVAVIRWTKTKGENIHKLNFNVQDIL